MARPAPGAVDPEAGEMAGLAIEAIREGLASARAAILIALAREPTPDDLPRLTRVAMANWEMRILELIGGFVERPRLAGHAARAWLTGRIDAKALASRLAREMVAPKAKRSRRLGTDKEPA